MILKSRISKKILLIFNLILLTILLISCKKTDPLYTPTDEFYINDTAGLLLNSTKWYIFRDGQILYEKSKNTYYDENIRGAQVVLITTFKERGSFDHTEVFNKYKIGDNDLGVLIIAYFDEASKDFLEVSYEIGINMMNYIPISRASDLEDIYLDGPYFRYDYDKMLFSFYLSFIEEISYVLYNLDDDEIYDGFYNFDDYLAEQYTVTQRLPSEGKIFKNLKTWHIILIVGILLFFGFLPKYGLFNYILPYLFSKNKGGGGSSRGYHN